MPDSIALYREPLVASEDEIRELERLVTLLSEDEGHTPTFITPSGETVKLPEPAAVLFLRLIQGLAAGNAVSVLPVHTLLTVTQAADLLNVSRPYLMQLLEQGDIPFSVVGGDYRIHFDDLVNYKHRRDESRREGLAEMTQLAEETGQYDLPDPQEV